MNVSDALELELYKQLSGAVWLLGIESGSFLENLSVLLTVEPALQPQVLHYLNMKYIIACCFILELCIKMVRDAKILNRNFYLVKHFIAPVVVKY